MHLEITSDLRIKFCSDFHSERSFADKYTGDCHGYGGTLHDLRFYYFFWLSLYFILLLIGNWCLASPHSLLHLHILNMYFEGLSGSSYFWFCAMEETTSCKPEPFVNNSADVAQAEFLGNELVVSSNVFEGILSHKPLGGLHFFR